MKEAGNRRGGGERKFGPGEGGPKASQGGKRQKDVPQGAGVDYQNLIHGQRAT